LIQQLAGQNRKWLNRCAIVVRFRPYIIAAVKRTAMSGRIVGYSSRTARVGSGVALRDAVIGVRPRTD
jgi:hypothetical protein